MKIVTHNSHFHTDDVFATAVLTTLYPDATVIRTRDPEVIATGDIVFDVGGVYDPEKKIFDHHQVGGAGKRENGIQYASFGLIWKHFGRELVSSDRAWERIERRVAWPIDARDNGMEISSEIIPEAHDYSVQAIIGAFNLTWKEEDEALNGYFNEAVSIAKKILAREIVRANALAEGEGYVKEAYDKAEDKRVLILDDKYPWGDMVAKWPEVLYVVSPRAQDTMWKVQAVRQEGYSFKTRKPLPAKWGGLLGDQLALATGVNDAVFCHRGLFMVAAKSKEGALKLAEIALNS